jgi:hypothetical protein
LVEVDIHYGMLKTLDIQWWDQYFSQRLDYMGISFRCTLYRKTGHLRSFCQGYEEEEELENSRLQKMPRVESLEFDSTAQKVPNPVSSGSLNDLGSNTLTGKLKFHCLGLFNTLTSWENLALDATSLPGTDSVIPTCDPIPASLLVFETHEHHLTSGLGSTPQIDLSLISRVEKPAHDLVRAHTTLLEPKVSLSVSSKTSYEVGATYNTSHAMKEIRGMGEDLGGTDPYLLSGYREDDPGDCSLGETLESLVPTSREADNSVSLTTYLGNNILPLQDTTNLVNPYELRSGGVGTSYTWSKGLGFETSPIIKKKCPKEDYSYEDYTYYYFVFYYRYWGT